MRIRQAVEKDVGEIRSLIKDNIVPRNFAGKAGLVEYALQPHNEYIYRIKSELFLVCQQENKLSGFFASFTDKFLETLPKSELTDNILLRTRPFVYGDLIIVSKKNREKYLSTSLVYACFEGMKKLEIYKFYGAISHYPFRNLLSIKIAEYMGLNCEEEFALSNGLVFGIYSKSLVNEK